MHPVLGLVAAHTFCCMDTREGGRQKRKRKHRAQFPACVSKCAKRVEPTYICYDLVTEFEHTYPSKLRILRSKES